MVINKAQHFIDLEFIERGHEYPIELISIGIVSSDDREYYAISTEFNPRNASQWVKDNVLACLQPDFATATVQNLHPNEWRHSLAWKSLQQIKEDILLFCAGGEVKPIADQSLDAEAYKQIEFWGEWSSYDWVVFCNIFGTMMDLPDGFPMRCNDVIQWAETHLGIPSDDLPASLETEGNHNALLGAKTVKVRYEWLAQKQKELITLR